MSKLRQKMHVAAILEAVLDVNDEGFVSYKEDWNDSRVAEECLTTTQIVVSVRKELYGGKFIRPKKCSKETLITRIEGLEKHLSVLSQRIDIIYNHLHLKAAAETTSARPVVPRWDLNS